MEAIQEGYGETGKFQLFSDYITDKTVNAQGEEVPCGTGYEEIHLLIESPDATLDTFSYGIIATDDNGGGGTGKYTDREDERRHAALAAAVPHVVHRCRAHGEVSHARRRRG